VWLIISGILPRWFGKNLAYNPAFRAEDPMSGQTNKSNNDNYITWLSKYFADLAVWSFDHRWVVLTLCLAVLGVCGWLASSLRVDSGFESYFDREDPAYKAYLQFREDFGSDENIFLLYSVPDREHGVFDVEIMETIQRLSKTLEKEVPFVKEVTSLTNAEIVEGVADGIEITTWDRDYTHDQENALKLKNTILNKPLYVGGLLSADAQYAAILVDMDRASTDPLDKIRLNPDAENPDALENLYPQVSNIKLEEILARPEYQGITFWSSGDVPINTVMNSIVQEEGVVLGAICYGLIALVLLLLFQFRVLGVLGPLAVVLCSVVMTVGFMGLMGWRWDMLSGMMPTLLTAVGIGAAVHIMTEFWMAYERIGDRREAIRETLYLVGVPCLLTSATTAAGFAATAISPIKALEHLSLYSAFGVMATFIFSVTLLMLFMSFGKLKPKSEKHPVLKKLTERSSVWLRNSADFNIRHQNGIVLFFMAVVLISLVGIFYLKVDSNFLEEFSDRVEVKHTTKLVDEVMGGTGGLVYLFDTGETDGIKDPAFLRELERVQEQANTDTFLVKKTYSIVDLLKDINQNFHGGDPAYYAIPQSRELVAQLLLVYEMSGGEELEQYVSSDYSRANLEIRCRNTETSHYQDFRDRMEDYLQQYPVQESTVTLTGIGKLWIQLTEYITTSQVRGLALAFVIITGMMCLVFRSVKIGIVSMLPNVSPIFFTLGIMGFAGINLDYTKLLIATIAVGIVVDDTIHFVTRYHHEFDRCGSYREALYRAFESVGRAMFITTAVLISGFMIFTLSLLESMQMFGLLISMTVTIALIADFLLMPVLILKLKLFGPEFTPRAEAK